MNCPTRSHRRSVAFGIISMASLAYCWTLMVTNARFGQEIVKFSVHPPTPYPCSIYWWRWYRLRFLSWRYCRHSNTLICQHRLVFGNRTTLCVVSILSPIIWKHHCALLGKLSWHNTVLILVVAVVVVVIIVVVTISIVGGYWLMGDSTMHRLYTLAQLQSIFMKRSVATIATTTSNNATAWWSIALYQHIFSTLW
jgi:hypothetical protein